MRRDLQATKGKRKIAEHLGARQIRSARQSLPIQLGKI